MEKTLLEIVQKIVSKYEALDALTQRNFNMLISGNVGTKETFHSFFIADLLDPNGTHGQKDLFLQLFWKNVLGQKYKLKKPAVWAEYVIKDDRRIDIVIGEDEKISAAIEMKIYAKDSQNQLKDYFTFIKLNNSDAKLYFLTLFGDSAWDESSKDVDYTPISFSKDIYNWLENCIKEVYDKPNIRESLFIYKNLIEKVTNKHKEKGEDIVETLSKDSKTIKAASEIYEHYPKAWAAKEYEFWLDLYDKIEKQTSQEWEEGDEIFAEKNHNTSVWYDRDGEVRDQDDSIEILYQIRFKSGTSSHFGIALKREIRGNTVYCVAGYWNDGDGIWIGVQIKDKNGNFLDGDTIIKFFNGENLGFVEKDETSIYNLHTITFASRKQPYGTFELFDKKFYKEHIQETANQMIDTIHRIDEIAKEMQ